MQQRGKLTAGQQATLQELRGRSRSRLGWFTFERARTEAFASPVPDDKIHGEIHLPTGTLEALTQGGYVELHEQRFRLTE